MGSNMFGEVISTKLLVEGLAAEGAAPLMPVTLPIR